MDAIGWNAASSSSGSTAPTGVAVAASLQGLANATGVTGLNAGAALANVAEKGGVGSDKYAYILGGSGDAGFRIVGTALDTGSVAVPGAVNGKLFALIVTADDTTNGTSSPAQSVNVVVGSAGADTINLASLSGMVTNAPTFIYGLGGGDTVNGSGMTGALFFDSAAGSDTFTGGRGSNFYLYGAAVDSTRARPRTSSPTSVPALTPSTYMRSTPSSPSPDKSLAPPLPRTRSAGRRAVGIRRSMSTRPPPHRAFQPRRWRST